MKNHLLLSILVLGGAAGAQTLFTSPKGYLTKEGDASLNYMLFSKHEMRWQTVDRSHVGSSPRPVITLAWRRDGDSSTHKVFSARTLTNFELYLANSDFNTIQLQNLDLNYKGTPTNCIVKRTLMLPDRSTKPANSPAPWDVALRFDKPFLFSGKDAFLWEVRYSSNTGLAKDYACDFQTKGSAVEYTSISGTTIGTACTSTGETSPSYFLFWLRNYGTKLRFDCTALRLPKSAPVFLNVDYRNSNLTIQGLCAPLIVMPLISFPLGSTTAAGSLPSWVSVDNVPHSPLLVGATLYFQLMALDISRPSGFPLVLSYGKSVKVPADPELIQAASFYHYKSTSTSTTRTSGPYWGGIVTRFGL